MNFRSKSASCLNDFLVSSARSCKVVTIVAGPVLWCGMLAREHALNNWAAGSPPTNSDDSAWQEKVSSTLSKFLYFSTAHLSVDGKCHHFAYFSQFWARKFPTFGPGPGAEKIKLNWVGCFKAVGGVQWSGFGTFKKKFFPKKKIISCVRIGIILAVEIQRVIIWNLLSLHNLCHFSTCTPAEPPQATESPAQPMRERDKPVSQ